MNPQRNRFTKFLLMICFIGALCSCAHKSGHGTKPESKRTSQQDEGSKSVSVSQKQNAEVIEIKSHGKELDGATIFSKYNSAVFMVFTTDGTHTYQGSGFFINSEGLAISNYHVFKGTDIGAEAIKLSNSDVIYSVKDILQRSDEEDFILFTVNCNHTNYIPIAASKPRVGDKVYAIGSPHGLENTFSSGEVSQWRDKNLMQISALIDHGSSGGALINQYGELVGITSGTFAEGSQANLNYAWSIDAVKPYLKIK